MGYDGLKRSPTTLYNFAYWQKFRSLKREMFCLNGRLVSEVYFDQIKQFVEAMNDGENKKRSFMSINNFKMMTHDQFESARAFDARFRDQLVEFKRKGYLDETLLIILSDHGGREYSYGNSVMEDFAQNEFPNPFLSIKLPDSMENTLFFENFMNNSAKLITSFDVYKTLKHFYFLSKNGPHETGTHCRKLMSKSEPKIRGLRGISLFENLPSQRSCTEALISIAFCACMTKTEVSTSAFKAETGYSIDQIALFVLTKLVRITSDWRLRVKCHEFRLEKVLHIKSFIYNKKRYYEIKISVIPGPAHFRAIVKFERRFSLIFNSGKVLSSVGKILRANKYGDQSECLKSYEESSVRPYCHCIVY
jgi:hypothetical protein